jgi:phosphoribosyl 1,2-cyclic phosphodiesterase
MNDLNYAVLGSGSKANSFVFSMGDFSFAVDNGFSGKEFLNRCEAGGFNPMNLRFILLTHTHRDHFNGVGVISRRLRIPVLCHRGLTATLNASDSFYMIRGGGGALYKVRDILSLSLFNTSHDAPYSTGYSFLLGKQRITILTDTGHISRDMEYYASRSDILFLEANYSESMLDQCRYPEFLKRRIRSREGHLGNRDSLGFLSRLRQNGRLPSRVFLCHLSADSNSPEQLESEMKEWNFTPGDNLVICPKGSYIPGYYES